MKIADPTINKSMVANIQELDRLGFKMRVNEYLNENEWVKGDVIFSVHTVVGSPPNYFKSLMRQKTELKVVG